MAQREIKFLVTSTYTDEELLFIADSNNLSIEQLTDEKLAEFLQDDLTEMCGEGFTVVLDLTKPPA